MTTCTWTHEKIQLVEETTKMVQFFPNPNWEENAYQSNYMSILNIEYIGCMTNMLCI